MLRPLFLFGFVLLQTDLSGVIFNVKHQFFDARVRVLFVPCHLPGQIVENTNIFIQRRQYELGGEALVSNLFGQSGHLILNRLLTFQICRDDRLNCLKPF